MIRNKMYLVRHRQILKLLRVRLHELLLNGVFRVEAVQMTNFLLSLAANAADGLFLRVGSVTMVTLEN